MEEKNLIWQESITKPIISRVGSVCRLATDLHFPLELLSGTRYDNWQVPFHIVCHSVEDIFVRFHLWQSSNGLLVAGKHHQSLYRGNHLVATKDPILVGDYLDGKAVLFASNSYNDRQKLWSCYIIHGDPPIPQTVSQHSYTYYQEILASDRTVHQELIELINQFFVQILPLCTANGMPIVTTAATAIFQSIKTQTVRNIEHSLNKQQEAQWH